MSLKVDYGSSHYSNRKVTSCQDIAMRPLTDQSKIGANQKHREVHQQDCCKVIGYAMHVLAYAHQRSTLAYIFDTEPMMHDTPNQPLQQLVISSPDQPVDTVHELPLSEL